MATSKLKRTIELELTLSEEEIKYLRGLLQNDLTGCESTLNKEMRHSIYTALNGETNVSNT